MTANTITTKVAHLELTDFLPDMRIKPEVMAELSHYDRVELRGVRVFLKAVTGGHTVAFELFD